LAIGFLRISRYDWIAPHRPGRGFGSPRRAFDDGPGRHNIAASDLAKTQPEKFSGKSQIRATLWKNCPAGAAWHAVLR
jgi:hypothetical protein